MEQELWNSFLRVLISLMIIITVVWYILNVIAEWMIFKKAGEKGWKSLIPVYSVYISHHIVGMSHIWFILEVVTWTIELFLEIFEKSPDWLVLGFGIPTAIITLVSGLVHVIKLCNCFGKGTVFKVGMIFLPSVFTLIIAYGKAEYKQPKH